MPAGIRSIFCLLAPLAWAQQSSPLLDVPPPPSDALRFGPALPPFEAKDTGGRVWRLEDLKGKYTLLYIWHTFEARDADQLEPGARAVMRGLPELDQLQRFYEEVRRSKTLQVLAFCRDYDYTHAPAYMKEKHYTFPVIADWVLLRKLLPPDQIHSRYGVVNPEGRISYPFRTWSFGRLLMELERVAGLKAPPAARRETPRAGTGRFVAWRAGNRLPAR
jgi:peroxiredoxin